MSKQVAKKKTIRKPKMKKPQYNKKWKRFTSKNDYTTTVFPGKTHIYQFDVPEGWATKPNEIYINFNMKITSDGSTALTDAAGMAISMGGASNLFSDGAVKVDGQLVESTNEYDKIAAMAKRVSKNRAQMESFYSDGDIWDPSWQKRKGVIVSDGYYDDEHITYNLLDLGMVIGTTQYKIDAATFECTISGGTVPTMTSWANVGDIVQVSGASSLVSGPITAVSADSVTFSKLTANLSGDIGPEDIATFKVWTKENSPRTFDLQLTHFPEMSIFRSNEEWHHGIYNLDLTAKNSVAMAFSLIESVVAKTTGFQVSVVNHEMWVPLFKRKAPIGTMIKSVLCYKATPYSIIGTGRKTYTSDVNSSIASVTIGVQDTDVDSSTLYSPSMFKIRSSYELGINSLEIKLGSITRPDYDDPLFVKSTGVDRLKNHWMATTFDSGNIKNPGGAEKFRDWYRRGPLYHFKLNRDPKEKEATTLKVRFGLGDIGSINPNLYIFEGYYKMVVRDFDKTGRIITKVIG